MAILQEAKKDVQVNGNFETSKFKIQASAKAFDILSKNIYRDPKKAVIRELSCNAHDSHVAAGNSDPFVVHLPTTLEKWFSVRDYGTGLSDSEVRNIFTTYFCSTKTESNDFVGALGLGSKSPFSVNDSFTVVSFINGTRNEYCCFKDECGEPQISLLTTSETSESNGLLVKVTVDDVYGWRDRAVSVYKTFDQLPIINCPDTKNELEEKTHYLLDTGEFKLTDSYGDLKAVMGNVAYNIPMTDDLRDGYRNILSSEGYVCFDIGDLSFDAGRENLTMDDRTIEKIKEKLDSLKSTIANHMKSIIDKEPTAFKRCLKADSFVSSRLSKHLVNHPDWNPADYELPKPTDSVLFYGSHRYRQSTYKDHVESIKPDKRSLFYWFEKGYVSRLKQHLKGSNCHAYIVTPEQAAECLIDHDAIKSMSELPAVERSTTSNGRCSTKTFVLNDRESYTPKWNWDSKDSYDINEQKVYVEICRWECVSHLNPRSLRRMLRNAGINITVYGIKSVFMKTKAFRDHNWIELKDYLMQSDIQNTLGTVVEEAEDVDIIEFIAKACDNNPEVQTILSLNKQSKESSGLLRLAKYFNLPYKKSNILETKVQDFLDKYPMLKYIKTYSTTDQFLKDVANYIN